MTDLTREQHRALRVIVSEQEAPTISDLRAMGIDPEQYASERHRLISEQLVRQGYPPLPPRPAPGINVRRVLVGVVLTILAAVIAFSVWGWCT